MRSSNSINLAKRYKTGEEDQDVCIEFKMGGGVEANSPEIDSGRSFIWRVGDNCKGMACLLAMTRAQKAGP